MSEQNQVNPSQAFKKPIQPLKILVVGATGGSGKAAVEKLLDDGHTVTAFSRSATGLNRRSEKLIPIDGDIGDITTLDLAMRGQDAVVVTLGISENPLRVRFWGAAHTPDNVRSRGTSHVITSMRKHNVRRLIVQTSFGIGETQGLLGFVDQLLFNLILKPQMLDTERQEVLVRDSDVDWVIVQPVHLTDKDTNETPFWSLDGKTRLMTVARKSVAEFLALAARDPDYIGKSVAVSG